MIWYTIQATNFTWKRVRLEKSLSSISCMHCHTLPILSEVTFKILSVKSYSKPNHFIFCLGTQTLLDSAVTKPSWCRSHLIDLLIAEASRKVLWPDKSSSKYIMTWKPKYPQLWSIFLISFVKINASDEIPKSNTLKIKYFLMPLILQLETFYDVHKHVHKMWLYADFRSNLNKKYPFWKISRATLTFSILKREFINELIDMSFVFQYNLFWHCPSRICYC